MKRIKFILINETSGKSTTLDSHHRLVSGLGHCLFINANFKSEGAGSKSRTLLIEELVRLRHHHPDAKILGTSEIDTTTTYAPVRVSTAMNKLRRELSER